MRARAVQSSRIIEFGSSAGASISLIEIMDGSRAVPVNQSQRFAGSSSVEFRRLLEATRRQAATVALIV